MTASRPICVHHSTSRPYQFFGRNSELALLDEAFAGGTVSVAALVGPGGQGKTAILQKWLSTFIAGERQADGVFFWSFYRGKDADLCLRALYAYAEDLAGPPEVSAGYCVDHLLPVLRRERWALILDGTEVVQYESGSWFGRFVHPELGRLIDELATEPMPGVAILTTRFSVPGLQLRKHARIVTLGGLDPPSSRGLLTSLGVHGSDAELDQAAAWCGHHAKAVELLGTYLARFEAGEACRLSNLRDTPAIEGASPEEQSVSRILTAFQMSLSQESQDILALATAFRDPPTESRLVQYLLSQPAQELLHHRWARDYRPFPEQPAGWLARQIDELVALRLLERVGGGQAMGETRLVIDAHPLVRRGFEHVLGGTGRRQSARARAGFLHGRPDRRKPASLEEAREGVELFHAYCDAGLWNEADGAYVAMDNPKHRFLAPAFERDLLLRFFPYGDWRRLPLWDGFGRFRSLAICFEMLGRFEDALAAYRPSDAPLKGDALIALGRLEPLLEQTQMPHPWQALWQAYRCHALCLAGRTPEAVALARSLVPVDVYEWVHVFECLLRVEQLQSLDLKSVLFRPLPSAEHRWAELARRRMRADYLRVTGAALDLGPEFAELIDAYDRGGLPYERGLVRLSYGGWLLAHGQLEPARPINAVTLELAARDGMRILAADAWDLEAELTQSETAREEARRIRSEIGYHGPGRP
jgi:hypothetical protein